MQTTVDLTERKLKDLGYQLPVIPEPVAKFAPVRVDGDTAYLSGAVAIANGRVLHPGKLGDQVSIAQAQEAARGCVLPLLAYLKSALGALDRVSSVVKMTGYINSTPEFDRPHVVMDAASQLLLDLFGEERGSHARCAVGTAALPLSAPVEIDLIVKISV